jgi:HK97 family phage portal protein
MLQKLLTRLGLKASDANRVITGYIYSPGKAVWTPVDYANLAEHGYQRNVIAYRCIDLIAKSAAGINWCLYRDKYGKKGKREEIGNPDHPLLQLIDNPNPLESRSSFITRVVSFFELHGQAYIEHVGPNNGPPRELHTHRPDRMKVLAGDTINPVRGYTYGEEPNIVEWSLSSKHPGNRSFMVKGNLHHRILHWKTFHPLHDFYGMSPIEAAARSVDQNNEARAWNVALLQNKAQPGLWVNFEETLSEVQRTSLEQGLLDRTGARNAGRSFITDSGKATITELGLTPAEMAWLEGIKLSTREICVAFGVPPELIGDSEQKTYSNYGEARKAFYEESVLPLMDSLRDALNGWLVPLFGERLYLDYDVDNIEALQEDRAALYASLEACSFLTMNEKREAAGYEAYTDEEADKLLVDSRRIPIDAVSVEEASAGTGGKPNSDAAAKAAAIELIAKMPFLGAKRQSELCGFEYDPPTLPEPPAPPQVTVHGAPVTVEPAQVHLAIHSTPAAVKTYRIERDENGLMKSVEVAEIAVEPAE